MITRYSAGMFMRISNTEEQKYMPMIWPKISTMMLLDLLDEMR